jgi:deoxyribose-phosphate aldolase
MLSFSGPVVFAGQAARKEPKTIMPASTTETVRFGQSGNGKINLPAYIDHTKLTYKEGEDQKISIQKLCAEARDNKFFAVCVRPNMITTAKNALSGSNVKTATVIGFPADKTTLADQKAFPTIGDFPLAEKTAEARKSIQDGADELDLVLNVRQFLAEAAQPEQVATVNEFKAIKEIAGDKIVKVILETDLLTADEVRKATLACVKGGVDMVKTSTGMVDGGKGATVENIRLIYQTLSEAGMADKMGIKASGGIKTAESAKALIKEGATRLGTSQGIAIVQGETAGEGY